MHVFNNVQLRDFPPVVDMGMVADMDAWIISQLDHPGPPMGDPSALSAGNQVIFAFIALNVDLQLEPTVLDVVGKEDMLEMNAPLGLRSRKTKLDMLLPLMIALIFLAFLSTCRLMEKWLPS